MSDSDLQELLDRLSSGEVTDADILELRKAAAAGNVTIASNERALAIGGSVTDTVIVTGDRNTVIRGPSAAAVQQALHDALDARALEQSVPLTRRTWRAWVRRHATPRKLAGASFAVVAAFGLLLGIYRDVLPFLPSSPVPMEAARFNIAVAEFGELDEQMRSSDSSAGRSLATSLFSVLEANLPGDLVRPAPEAGALAELGLRSPAETDRVTGGSREERARRAETVARQINADIVIYGNLTVADGRTQLAPEFYLSDRLLHGANELPGHYELGTPIEVLGDITTSPLVLERLRSGMEPRVRALGQFIRGLDFYQYKEFATAERYFIAAADTEGWEEADGKEVLYIFMGNTAGRRGDLAQAEAYYARALELEPGYARGHLGLAEVAFQRGRHQCQATDVDVVSLRQAEVSYNTALTSPLQPAHSKVGTKAAFGLGRIHLCLSGAGIEDRWAAAEREFQSVIGSVDIDSILERELAVEAHANLGLLRVINEQAYGSREVAYREAAAAYGLAISLTDDPSRRALFYTWLAYIDLGIGLRDEASRHLELADEQAARSLEQGISMTESYYALREQVGKDWDHGAAVQ